MPCATVGLWRTKIGREAVPERHHPLCSKCYQLSKRYLFIPQLLILLLHRFQVVGFFWGYYCEQFVQTIYILGAGVLLACLVYVLVTIVVYTVLFLNIRDPLLCERARSQMFLKNRRLYCSLVVYVCFWCLYVCVVCVCVHDCTSVRVCAHGFIFMCVVFISYACVVINSLSFDQCILIYNFTIWLVCTPHVMSQSFSARSLQVRREVKHAGWCFLCVQQYKLERADFFVTCNRELLRDVTSGVQNSWVVYLLEHQFIRSWFLKQQPNVLSTNFINSILLFANFVLTMWLQLWCK